MSLPTTRSGAIVLLTDLIPNRSTDEQVQSAAAAISWCAEQSLVGAAR